MQQRAPQKKTPEARNDPALRLLGDDQAAITARFDHPAVIAGRTDGAATPRVQILPNESTRRVGIVIDGKPFTSYIWPENLAKPVLYPLRGPRCGCAAPHSHSTG